MALDYGTSTQEWHKLVLVTRAGLRLDEESTRTVVAEALAHGLIVTADKWSLTPSDLFRACMATTE